MQLLLRIEFLELYGTSNLNDPKLKIWNRLSIVLNHNLCETNSKCPIIIRADEKQLSTMPSISTF